MAWRRQIFSLIVVCCLVRTIAGQTCGVPKSFDTMALGQQFRTPRIIHERFRETFKRPIFQPEGDLEFREQTVQHPWLKTSDKISNKIVGGYDIIDASGGQLCWQIGLIIGLYRGFFNCGGTILGSRTILTAAHCVVSWRGGTRLPAEFTVVAGALSGGFNGTGSMEKAGAPGGGRFTVSKVVMHPQYDAASSNNDLALLILSSDMDFSKPCMCAACLTNRSPNVGEFCISSGYGNENEGGTINRTPIPLRWVYLQVLNNVPPTCSQSAGTTTDLFVCAGNVVGQDTCQGDSGGPFVCWDPVASHYYSAGVVSFGDGCARGIGGQYTKVAKYNQWIADNSGGNVVFTGV